MEIHLKNYDFASECLIKSYIAKSNRYQPEADNVQGSKGALSKLGERSTKDGSNHAFGSQSNVRPWLRGQAAKTFTLQGDPSKNLNDQLPLTNKQYYELMELLIFHIHLPDVGMSRTLRILKDELPMHSKIKEQFISRLGQIRNLVVADVQLTNG